MLDTFKTYAQMRFYFFFLVVSIAGDKCEARSELYHLCFFFLYNRINLSKLIAHHDRYCRHSEVSQSYIAVNCNYNEQCLSYHYVPVLLLCICCSVFVFLFFMIVIPCIVFLLKRFIYSHFI